MFIDFELNWRFFIRNFNVYSCENGASNSMVCVSHSISTFTHVKLVLQIAWYVFHMCKFYICVCVSHSISTFTHVKLVLQITWYVFHMCKFYICEFHVWKIYSCKYHALIPFVKEKCPLELYRDQLLTVSAYSINSGDQLGPAWCMDCIWHSVPVVGNASTLPGLPKKNK